jgi:hypothetical protein
VLRTLNTLPFNSYFGSNTMKTLGEMNFVPEPYERHDSNNMGWTHYCIYWKLDIQTIEDRSRYRIFDAHTGEHYYPLTPIEAQAVVYELLKEWRGPCA